MESRQHEEVPRRRAVQLIERRIAAQREWHDICKQLARRQAAADDRQKAGTSEQDVQQLMALLNHKLEAFNASGGKPYRLSLAMGYTIWEEEAFDPDTFLHRMDIQMYKSKNRFHAGKSEAARR